MMNLFVRGFYVFNMVALLILWPSYTFAQDNNRRVIDSLIQELPSAQNDSISIILHLKLYDLYNLYSADTAKSYLDNASVLSRDYDDPFIDASVNARIADLLINQGKLDSALQYIDKSLPYFESNVEYSDANSIGYLYGQFYSVITVHYMRAEYEQALEYNKKAIDLLHQQEERGADWNYDLAKLYHLRGVTLFHSELPDKAKQYMSKALETSDNPIMIGHASKALAVFYQEEGKLDSAEIALKNSLASCEDTGIHHVCFTAHAQLGSFYRESKKFDQSLFHYQEALHYAKLQNSIHGIFNSHQGMGNLQTEMGDYRAASKSYHNLEVLYNQYPDLELGDSFYKLWGEVEQEIGNYQKSSELFQRFIVNRDSLLSEENRMIIADVEGKYELAQKEAQINKEKLISNRRENQRNLFLGGSLFFALLGMFLWQRSRKNKELFAQSDVIQKQKIEQLEKEKKILSMNAMIEGQEAERTRIAKDLHDGLGGLLATVKAHFGNIQKEIKQLEGLQVYDRAQDMMDEACDEVRRISHNLMPGALRLEGLKTAVEQLGEEMNAAHPFKVNIEFINFESRLEESKEVFIYRIIQESLNNIIKHAEADQILVQLTETDTEYHFIIEDDGKGFDPLHIDAGLGLKSIRSRVDFLQGNLDIDTRENVGTTVSFHIPKTL